MNSIKVLTMAGLMLISAKAIAQKSKVNSADRHREDNEVPQAVKDIEEAAANPETKDKAKTWLIRGRVYKQICLDTSKVAKSMNMPDASVEAMKSFKRALELKADKDYTKDIEEEYLYLANGIFNEGINYYNNALQAKDSAEAVNAFKKAISRYTMFYEAYNGMGSRAADLDKRFEKNKLSVMDPKFYMAISYENIKDRANAEKTLQELADKKYPKVQLYSALAEMYADEKEKKYDQAIKLLDDAYAFLPEDQRKGLLVVKLHIYILEGKPSESIEVGKKALANDPNNTDICIALANNYETLNMDKEAEEMYKQAVSKNPDGIRPNFAVATSIYNKGVIIYNASTKEKDYRKQAPIIENAKKVWMQAIPYLEKAANATDKDLPKNKETLKETYKLLKLIYAQFEDKEAEFAKYNKLWKEFDQKK